MLLNLREKGKERTVYPFSYLPLETMVYERLMKKTLESLVTFCSRIKKDHSKEYEPTFIENGSILLKMLIAEWNGKCNPIHHFSYEEINTATNNFDEKQVIRTDWLYQFYEGYERNRAILVKKFHDGHKWHNYIFTDIVFASQMSFHKSCLKLIGCCLETKNPILVLEFAANGSVADHIYGPNKTLLRPLLWTQRLKIAIEITNVIAYLHAGFPRPIAFRNLDLSMILLDKNYVAKLSNFSDDVTIPECETHVPASFQEAFGYNTPDNMSLSFVNENVDVYSFALCLLVLLTGKRVLDDARKAYEKQLVVYVKKYVEKGMLGQIVDPMLLEEGLWHGKEQQIQCFVAVALRCLSKLEEKRPTMIDVAKELRQMYQSLL